MTLARVVIGLLGTRLDRGEGDARWKFWRPTVAVCQHEDLLIDRYELLHEPKQQDLAECTAADIASVSPETEVRLHAMGFHDPWDFEEVYGKL
ncbi:MAG: hypothetical protein KDA61_22900, partial [Planctomycetales bacterium]|nr:hypothetical protein [Planctomycetales bacterium]